MKAILVIDKSESCVDCRLRRGLFCGGNGNSLYDYIHNDDSNNDKPSWCPLKPLPENGLTVGRNLLIDEILGEKNDTDI